MTGTTRETPGEQGCAPPGRDRSFWERIVVGWHAVFYGLIGLSSVVVLLDGPPSPRGRVVAEVVLAGLAGWYVAFGRTAIERVDPGRAVVYLAGLFAATYTLIAIDRTFFILLFAVFPQIWASLGSVRNAMAASAFFAAGLLITMAGLSGWTRAGWVTAGVGALVNLVLSGLLGLWMSGVVAESEQRADLIGELRRTRQELAEVSRAAGALAERERLSAEIHDTLAQGFTSVLMLVQAAEADVDCDPEAARRHLKLAQETARENLAEARSLVAALAPPVLDAGLPAALGRLVHQFGRELEILSTVDVRGPVRALPANCEVVLLRAAQEALANVRKHAVARTVTVTLTFGEESTGLSVRDDGRGFDPDAAPPTGYGLPGMRNRLRQVGGRITVHSGPGQGTTVTAEVPA
jgi:signal transduction histidine kinase